MWSNGIHDIFSKETNVRTLIVYQHNDRWMRYSTEEHTISSVWSEIWVITRKCLRTSRTHVWSPDCVECLRNYVWSVVLKWNATCSFKWMSMHRWKRKKSKMKKRFCVACGIWNTRVHFVYQKNNVCRIRRSSASPVNGMTWTWFAGTLHLKNGKKLSQIIWNCRKFC